MASAVMLRRHAYSPTLFLQTMLRLILLEAAPPHYLPLEPPGEFPISRRIPKQVDDQAHRSVGRRSRLKTNSTETVGSHRALSEVANDNQGWGSEAVPVLPRARGGIDEFNDRDVDDNIFWSKKGRSWRGKGKGSGVSSSKSVLLRVDDNISAVGDSDVKNNAFWSKKGSGSSSKGKAGGTWQNKKVGSKGSSLKSSKMKGKGKGQSKTSSKYGFGSEWERGEGTPVTSIETSSQIPTLSVKRPSLIPTVVTSPDYGYEGVLSSRAPTTAAADDIISTIDDRPELSASPTVDPPRRPTARSRKTRMPSPNSVPIDEGETQETPILATSRQTPQPEMAPTVLPLPASIAVENGHDEHGGTLSDEVRSSSLRVSFPFLLFVGVDTTVSLTAEDILDGRSNTLLLDLLAALEILIRYVVDEVFNSTNSASGVILVQAVKAQGWGNSEWMGGGWRNLVRDQGNRKGAALAEFSGGGLKVDGSRSHTGRRSRELRVQYDFSNPPYLEDISSVGKLRSVPFLRN